MRELLDVLKIRVPVLQAPMAAGPVGPELVAAVSRAGALGMLGVMGMTADAVRADVRRAFELGATSVAVNVQLAPPERGAGEPDAVAALLAPFETEAELGEQEAGPPADPPLTLVEAGLEAGATVVSAALGDPAPLAPLAQAAGVPLVAMVSTVDEARAAVAAG